MKKILSIAAFALLTGSICFTACRNDAGSQTQTEEAAQPETPATESAAPATDADAQEATAAPADTTQQAQ